MTEAEWLANTSSKRMLRFLNQVPKRRKPLLFAVACCRRLGDLLIDARSRSVLEVLETFADGTVTKRAIRSALALASAAATEVDVARVEMELQRSRRTVESTTPAFGERYRIAAQHHHASRAVEAALESHRSDGADYCASSVHIAMRCQNALGVAGPEEDAFGVDVGRRSESMYQAALLRDLFGNPYHSVTFSPSWRTDTSVAIATQMYDARNFSAMPILADALQDAGCDSTDILDHCRGSGPHVRGCWVVDLVLGKE
jgi:hypothetical protein